MQKYLHLFKKSSDNIVLASFKDFDVQSLLKESAVLITDFSSVFFDFAYMKKPIIYFQFDKETFYGRHYRKGYFDYRDIGFGDVCGTVDEVTESLLRLFDSDFAMSEHYLQRTENFFPLCDRNNCNRIYELIVRE
jgi:CDP-glycerol glycerophosphotransferase (TagB/SpsB family)